MVGSERDFGYSAAAVDGVLIDGVIRGIGCNQVRSGLQQDIVAYLQNLGGTRTDENVFFCQSVKLA